MFRVASPKLSSCQIGGLNKHVNSLDRLDYYVASSGFEHTH